MSTASVVTLELNHAIQSNSVADAKATLAKPSHSAYVNECENGIGERQWLTERLEYCIRQGASSNEVLQYLLSIWTNPAQSFIGGLLREAYENSDITTLKLLYEFYLSVCEPSKDQLHQKLTELSQRYEYTDNQEILGG